MDSYIKETQKRYIEDLKRFNSLKDEIERLQDEAHKLGGKLHAYSRILKDELGDEVVRKLDEEIHSATKSHQSKARIESSEQPLSITNAIKVFERSGFSIRRVTGSHYILKEDKRILTVPYHNKDLKRGTLASIIRQSGFSIEEFLDLL